MFPLTKILCTTVVHKVKDVSPYQDILIIIQKLNIQVIALTLVYYSIQTSPLKLRHLNLGTSLCIPFSYHVPPASFRCSSFAKRLPARCSFILVNRKKSDGARSELYGGCSKMSQWNCSCSEACVCREVYGRALSCNRTIPRDSLPLRQYKILSACRKE